MQHRTTENGLSFLGGALLGAAAMYLLDPEQGRERREHLGDVAGGALHRTGDALTPAWERARDLTAGLGASLADRAQDASSRASKAYSAAYSRASDTAGDLRDHAGDHLSDLRHRIADFGKDLLDRARHLGGDAGDRARRATHPYRHSLASAIDPEHHGDQGGHAALITTATLSAAAIGVGLMYFLDPARGRARRNYVRDQVTHALNHTGKSFHRTGVDLANRLRGTAYQTRSYVNRTVGNTGPEVSGDVLLQRVRSQLGHLVSYPAAIQLMTDARGSVSLYGRVLASELDQLLKGINAVAGVSEVNNRLEVQDTVEGVTGYTASSSTTGQGVPQL